MPRDPDSTGQWAAPPAQSHAGARASGKVTVAQLHPPEFDNELIPQQSSGLQREPCPDNFVQVLHRLVFVGIAVLFMLLALTKELCSRHVERRLSLFFLATY